MRFTRVVPLLAAGAALALFGGACNKESLGPGTIVDTTATTAALTGVDSAFQVQAFASFSALSGHIGAAAAAPRLGDVITATLPRMPGASAAAPYVNNAARMLAIQRLLQTLRPGQVTIIPDSVRGTIFKWDSASASYTAQATGGPSNGVRFWLYSVDSTGTPTFPLNQVGNLDILDEGNSGALTKLELKITSPDAALTYVDYTVTIFPTGSGFTAQVAGTISGNGKTLTFSVSTTVSVNSGAHTVTVTDQASFHLSSPAISVSETVTFTLDTNTGVTSVTVNVTFSRSGETLRFAGTVTITPDSAGSTITFSGTVYVNGQVYATASGDFDNPTWAGNGRDLTPEEIHVLNHLRDLGRDVIGFLDDALRPIENLLGA